MSLFVNPAQFAETGRSRPLPPRRGARPGAGSRRRRRRRLRSLGRRDVPTRLPDLGRRDRARRDPRRSLPARPLPRRGDDRPQALHDRPSHPRLLRAEGRAAGRGDPDADPRPRARGRAPRRADRARRRRPRALVAKRTSLPAGAGRCSRTPARARHTQIATQRSRSCMQRTASRSTTSRSPTSIRLFSPAPSASARPASSTTSCWKETPNEHPPAEARSRHAGPGQAPDHGARRDEGAAAADRHGHGVRRARRPTRRRGGLRPRARRRLRRDDHARPRLDRARRPWRRC